MNNYDYTLKILNIQDKYITLEKVEFINNIYYIHLIQSKNPDLICDKCGGVSITKNSTYVRTIKYIPIDGFPAFIKLYQPRFKCLYCNTSFNQQTNIIGRGNSISNKSKEEILKESSYKQSFKDISKRTNTSQTTVSNEFKKEINDFRCKLSRIIRIDEFKTSTIAGKYALIIANPENGEILDILPSRLQDYIYHYFNTIDKSERLNVEYVVTDLFESYRTICKNLFWNSIHVADKFHWVKQTTEAFNKMRINIMNYHLKSKNSDSITYANILKHNYKLLLINRYYKESCYFDQQYRQNKMGFTTLESVIEYCINYDSDFEEAYTLLQKLYYISRYSSYETARKDILKWCELVERSEKIIPEFKKVALTYKSWLNEIVNSFIIDKVTHKRLNNAFIEVKNNFCKVIKRVGFGYSDFDVFRYKILIANNKK